MRRLAVALIALLLPAVCHAQAVPDVDGIVVSKSARTLVLWAHGAVVYTIHNIQLGEHPGGAKHFQGDGRTPEGHYLIDSGNRDSAYHLSLHISYPAAADVEYAYAHGREPGGAIFIHGQPNDWTTPGRVPGDWTDGCIAVSNQDIELLWQSVGDGTPIDILP